MSEHDDDTCPHLVRASLLEAENARLKAEVERLRKFNEEALAHIAKEERKSWERLDMAQDEVERLDTLCKQVMAQHSDISCENIMLRKAGDAMAFHYQELVRIEWGQFTTHIPPSVQRWNAAKEGKQP